MRKVISLALVLFWAVVLQEIYFSQVPYVPTPEDVVEGMLKIAKVNSGDMLYDLGCGDGRIVVTAAKKYGARGVGVDNNPVRIKESWENAKKNGVTDKVDFKEQNLFDTDLRSATVVTLYLLPAINLQLRPKLFKELKPGVRVVSHSFTMDTWDPDSTETIDGRRIYYWKMPANISGTWDIQRQGSNQNSSYSLQVEQEFQKVNGTIKVGGKEYNIKDAKVDGNRLVYHIDRNEGGMRINATVTAQINGDEITGKVESPDGNISGNFTAKRKTGTRSSIVPAMTTESGW